MRCNKVCLAWQEKDEEEEVIALTAAPAPATRYGYKNATLTGPPHNMTLQLYYSKVANNSSGQESSGSATRQQQQQSKQKQTQAQRNRNNVQMRSE